MEHEAEDYLKINKECWELRTGEHVASDFYNLEAFLKGASSLNPPELELLGDVKDKKILHLQCHFGQDTLSLARMGAKVTGVDFSEKAIAKANELNHALGLDAHFICCDVYRLPEVLSETFDIVFTSYGAIGWLPDTDRWAAVVSHFLKPSGKFVFVEFHPFIWMYDNTLKTIQYSYFNVAPIVEHESGTYADKDAPIATRSIGWNHPVSDVLNSLISHGLQIIVFKEYDYSPYNVFPDMEEFENGKYRVKTFGNKLPLLYAVQAIKNWNL